jgi:peptidoglycan/LPS O-acetylase OafA/YrhL
VFALFFVLSGFVIAHTLTTRSRQPGYGFGEFFTERFARIYTAYLPALLLVAIADNWALASGLAISITSIEWHVFFKNLFLLEGYPRINAPTYGSAGQFNSVALEFHIYIFVGALYFAWLGRNRLVVLVIAALSCMLPLAWLAAYPDPDRTLFWLWLLGFGGYLLASRCRFSPALAFLAALVFAGAWFWQRVPGQEYALLGYPFFALAFVALAIATQKTKAIISRPWLARAAKFAADYSYSLFLIHYTAEEIIAALWTGPTWVGISTAILVSNVLAVAFALLTERHYRRVATYMKQVFTMQKQKPAVAGVTR